MFLLYLIRRHHNKTREKHPGTFFTCIQDNINRRNKTVRKANMLFNVPSSFRNSRTKERNGSRCPTAVTQHVCETCGMAFVFVYQLVKHTEFCKASCEKVCCFIIHFFAKQMAFR